MLYTEVEHFLLAEFSRQMHLLPNTSQNSRDSCCGCLWIPQFIENLNDGRTAKLITKIEREGIGSTAQRTLTWFDHVPAEGSGDSARRAAYGLSRDSVLTEHEDGRKRTLM